MSLQNLIFGASLPLDMFVEQLPQLQTRLQILASDTTYTRDQLEAMYKQDMAGVTAAKAAIAADKADGDKAVVKPLKSMKDVRK